MKEKCVICGKKVSKCYLSRHYKQHGKDVLTIIKHHKKLYGFDEIKFEDLFLEKAKQLLNNEENIQIYRNVINNWKSVCDYILQFKGEITKIDLERFFNEFMPWRKENPKVINSKEMAEKIIGKKDAMIFYEQIIKPKNPYFNHGGKMSPFSKKFVKYKKLSEEQKENEVQKIVKKAEKDKAHITRIEYWLEKGYSKEAAKQKLRERQQTFTKEKCIEKYGEQEGLKRWEERQEKWLNTMNSKSLEEKKRINRAKMKGISCISKAEKEITKKLNLDKQFTQVSISNETGWLYDICVGNKIIEYNGDYWHCNPNKYNKDYYNERLHMTAKEKWKKDKKKIEFAKNNGYKVKIVWESEYKKNPDKILKECKEWIENL